MLKNKTKKLPSVNKICFSKRKCELCNKSGKHWLSNMFCTYVFSREAGFLDSIR